jgi:hypothetical protein
VAGKYDYKQWKDRIASRSDITGMVTHLTKPPGDTTGMSEEEIDVLAVRNLIKILEDSVIFGSTTDSGFIVGRTPAVCFQEAPLYGLVQNVEHEYRRRTENPAERRRYCGIGLAFSKWYVFTHGGRPVLYEQTSVAKRILPETEYWRIVNIDLTIGGDACIDWTHEREWRLPGDFNFTRKFAHVVLHDARCWKYFIENCPTEIFHEIYGITVLKSIMM